MKPTPVLSDIHQIHLAHRQAYGALKTWRALNEAGIPCGKHRVARLRREAGILAKREARFRVTVEHHQTPQAGPICWIGSFRRLRRTECGWAT